MPSTKKPREVTVKPDSAEWPVWLSKEDGWICSYKQYKRRAKNKHQKDWKYEHNTQVFNSKVRAQAYIKEQCLAAGTAPLKSRHSVNHTEESTTTPANNTESVTLVDDGKTNEQLDNTRFTSSRELWISRIPSWLRRWQHLRNR